MYLSLFELVRPALPPNPLHSLLGLTDDGPASDTSSNVRRTDTRRRIDIESSTDRHRGEMLLSDIVLQIVNLATYLDGFWTSFVRLLDSR